MALSRHFQRVARKSTKAGAAAADKLTLGFDRPDAQQQSDDGDLRLHPRKRHAGAGMDAGAEGEMAIGMATDVKALRFGELRGIAIGGANADMNVGSARQRHAA